MIRAWTVGLILAAALSAAEALAGVPDWDAVADVEEIEVVTTNEDGSPRETTIWLAVVDGQGFIRTSGLTTWGHNAERNADVVLRVEGEAYELRVEFIEDDALRDRVKDTFREKYGFSDAMISITRGFRPSIMRLVER